MSRVVITIVDEPDGSCSIRCEPMIAAVVSGGWPFGDSMTTAESYAVCAWLAMASAARRNAAARMIDGGDLTLGAMH